MRVHFKGGVNFSSSQVSLFWGWRGGQKRVRSIFQGGPDTPENTLMDFLKVIYENAEKKNIHFATIISIYTGFEVL